MLINLYKFHIHISICLLFLLLYKNSISIFIPNQQVKNQQKSLLFIAIKNSYPNNFIPHKTSSSKRTIN